MIIFEPQGRRIEVEKGETLLDAARRIGVGIRTDCGGKGTCGKCRVIVNTQSGLSELSKAEKERLTDREVSSNYRLACQTILVNPEGSVTVVIPPESRLEMPRLQMAGVERAISLRPAISKIHLRLHEPSLRDPMPDSERLIKALRDRSGSADLRIGLTIVRHLSRTLRDADWDVTVTLWRNKEIVNVEKGNTATRLHGFAVDIGTSKIVGALVDLRSGKTLSVSAVENPQLPRGEDVMSRITFASRSSENLREMSSVVRDAINGLILECCANSEVTVHPEEVYELTVVGNTVMHHLFLSIPPFYLSQAPYVPSIRNSLDVQSDELRIRASPGSTVHCLPIIAGFVGADTTADVIATGIHRSNKMSLLIDIGTNTEVVLGNKEGLVSCSCASGPAFEGMHIRHGMKAVPGAIEKVEVSPEGREVAYETIDGERAVGICGSGMIDIIASLFRRGLINKRGYFTNPSGSRYVEGTRGKEFVVVGKDETAGGENVTVDEEDILAILLAKGAVEAGCNILIKKRKIEADHLDRILIAGAFGSNLNIANSKTIGLIPNIPSNKITLVGNVAMSGAKMCLLSTRKRDEASALSRRIEYVELAAESTFAKEFSHSLFIPHKNTRPSAVPRGA